MKQQSSTILASLFRLSNQEMPLIQAPMAGVQDQDLAISVAKAGALGSIPCAMLSVEQIIEQINICHAQQVQHFNLNFFCHQPPRVDRLKMQHWAEALQPHFDDLNITAKLDTAAGRTPFNQEIIDALQELKPPIFSFHFGLPSPELLAQIKAWGAIVMSSATSLAEGLWLQANGADIVIAQGLEAGGHRAMFLETDISMQQTTFSLVPQLVNALSIPVIAAGAIVDEHSVRAAMSLGASGVQVGTSYLLCNEANTSAVHRKALTSKQAQRTCLTNVFTGRPARSIVNKAVLQLGPMSSAAPEFPLASALITQLRQVCERADSSDFSPLWSGQNNTGCKAISATDLTFELARGFKD